MLLDSPLYYFVCLSDSSISAIDSSDAHIEYVSISARDVVTVSFPPHYDVHFCDFTDAGMMSMIHRMHSCKGIIQFIPPTNYYCGALNKEVSCLISTSFPDEINMEKYFQFVF